jgi:methionyl-tRNA formyltransferase
MNILYLGPQSPLVDFLSMETVRRTEEPISDFGNADFVISYGYRHIIRNKEELKRMDGRAINLHISYLPWNRGADPNLWSWIDETPKGVTIHYIDPGIDTGDIIVQEKVDLPSEETLRSSYALLQHRIQKLFFKHWRHIRDGHCHRVQHRGGTFHTTRDRETVEKWLTSGWDTPVRELIGITRKEC